MTALRRCASAALASVVVGMAAAAGARAAVPPATWYWSLVVPGSSPAQLLLGTSSGLYDSANGGKTWHPTGPSGVDATSLVQLGSTIFTAGVRSKPGGGAVSVEGGVYLVLPGRGVLASSGDGGKSWRLLTPRGLPTSAVQALATDPGNSRVLLVLLRSGSLYRSSDGGVSFRPLSSRVGGTPWALALTQVNHLVAGNMSSGNYVSTNGSRWHDTGFVDPRGSDMVMEYAVQPTDPSRVLMTSYGVLMSSDGGTSWHVVLKSAVMFGPIAWAPRDPGLVYAVGWDRSLWRSTNGGTSWTKAA